MRTLAIGILALLCGGCAAPALDLVSRDPEAPWLVGQRWVRTESSRATVTASFDRFWLDRLVFRVEVVNQSDSTLVVDPSQFSFTLASSAGSLSPALRKRFTAEDPDKVRTRLENASPEGGGWAALMLVGAAAAVALTVLGGDLVPAPPAETQVESPGYASGSCTQPETSDAGPDPPPAHDDWEASNFDRERARSIRDLLEPTELAPGASVSGEVWLPAKPLRKVLGAESSDLGHGITARPAPAPADYALTLRTPDALGGQEIEYSVAAQ